MKFPRPQHQEPSEFGGGSGAEVGSADQAPRTSAPTRAPRHNKHPTNKYTNEKNNNAKAHAHAGLLCTSRLVEHVLTTHEPDVAKRPPILEVL